MSNFKSCTVKMTNKQLMRELRWLLKSNIMYAPTGLSLGIVVEEIERRLIRPHDKKVTPNRTTRVLSELL